MTIETNTLETFVDQFERVSGQLPGGDKGWLNERRETALERFQELGIPTPRMESWKYTRIPDLVAEGFRPVESGDGEVSVDRVPTLFGADAAVPRLVFVNGLLRDELSSTEHLPDGIVVEPLAAALERDPDFVKNHMSNSDIAEDRGFSALNTAMMDSGMILHARRGFASKIPVEVVYMNGGADVPVGRHPRNLFVVEEGADVTLVMHHSGLATGGYLTNSVTDVVVGDGARMRRYVIQNENIDAMYISALNAKVGRDGTFESFNLAIGGRLSRYDVRIGLEGKGAHASLNGAYMMRGREHCDNTTRIDHLVPHTSCSEVFKGVLNDESRGVFQGKIVVHKDAQHTDGHQLSKTLLLSDKAEMDAKPELEIYADDVKCSHGATTGQIDETALFYLRSRGVPDALARNLLIQSFLAEAVETITDERVNKAVMDLIVHRLPAQCFLSEEWRRE